MVKSDRVDGHKTVQIVLIRDVISMPGDDIKRAVVLIRPEEGALELGENLPGVASVFEVGRGVEEVSRIGKSVGTWKVVRIE